MNQAARIFFSQNDELLERLKNFGTACRNEKPSLRPADISDAFARMVGFEAVDDALAAISPNVSYIVDSRLNAVALRNRHSHFISVLSSIGLGKAAAKRIIEVASPSDGRPFERYSWLLGGTRTRDAPQYLRAMKGDIGRLADTAGVVKFAALCGEAIRDDPYWDERQSVKFYESPRGTFRDLMSTIRRHPEHPALVITALRLLEEHLVRSREYPRHAYFSDPDPALKALMIGDVDGLSDAVVAFPMEELLRTVNVFRQNAGRSIAEAGAGIVFQRPSTPCVWSTSTAPWVRQGGKVAIRPTVTLMNAESPWVLIGGSEDIGTFCFEAYEEPIEGVFWASAVENAGKELSRSRIGVGLDKQPFRDDTDDWGRKVICGVIAIGWSANRYSRKVVIGLAKVWHSADKGDAYDGPSHNSGVEILRTSPYKKREVSLALTTYLCTEMQDVVCDWDRVLRPATSLRVYVECDDYELCDKLDEAMRYALDFSEDGAGADTICIAVQVDVDC